MCVPMWIVVFLFYSFPGGYTMRKMQSVFSDVSLTWAVLQLWHCNAFILLFFIKENLNNVQPFASVFVVWVQRKSKLTHISNLNVDRSKLRFPVGWFQKPGDVLLTSEGINERVRQMWETSSVIPQACRIWWWNEKYWQWHETLYAAQWKSAIVT